VKSVIKFLDEASYLPRSSLEGEFVIKMIMRKNNVLPILFCMFSMFVISACEKAEIQKTTTSTVPIHSRFACPVDDCDDCPPADCCCSVQLLSAPPATIHFCGTSGECVTDMACSAENVGNCPDINGFKEIFTFQNQFQTELFCVPKNAPFGITFSSGTHQVRITCQVGQSNPQFVTMTLNTPPDKPYWSTNDNCELTNCF